MRLKSTCFEFELRGQVGLICGRAHIGVMDRRDWSVTRIHLYSPTGAEPGRDLVLWSEEYDRTEHAIRQQDTDRIDSIIAALWAYDDGELARAS